MAVDKQTLFQMAQTLLAHGDKLSDEELQQIKLKTDALERARVEGHHDHDHPSIFAVPAAQVVRPS